MNKDNLLSILNSISLFSNVKEIALSDSEKRKKLTRQFEFSTLIDGGSLNFMIEFKDTFPSVIPLYYLIKGEKAINIPHVDNFNNGCICYTSEDNVVLDYRNPKGIIEETFESVKKIVSDGLNRKNQNDFTDEFENYWSKLNCKETFLSNLDISKKGITRIKVGISEKRLLVAENEFGIYEILKKLIVTDKTNVTFTNAWYIPIPKGEIIIPPISNEEVTLQYIQKLIYPVISLFDKRKLEKMINKDVRSIEYVFFSFETSKGNYGIFAVKFKNIKSIIHPLLSDNFSIITEPAEVKRIDKEFILKRGSSDTNLNDKKGLVIGCGSIGGYVSLELIKAGILNLTLADNDILSIGNIYRHVLGRKYVGKNKASALKEYITDNYPYSMVDVIDAKIENHLDTILLNKYDFVVVATGNPTINMLLNKKINENMVSIPTVYTWNDPYGIGGHVLVTNINKKGCYECLYSNADLYNVASFAGKDQPKPFVKSITGCGSLFTPFSSLDSLQTSIMTVRNITQILNGEIIKNSIFSWKGNAENFLKEGFKLSDRYDQSIGELDVNKTLFYNSECEICN